MDIIIFKNELTSSLGALKQILSADGVLSGNGQKFLVTLASLHGATVDVESLAAPPVEEIAASLSAHQKKRLVQLAIIAALSEGVPSVAKERAVVALANALQVPEPGLKVLSHVVRGNRLRARVLMTRRLMLNFFLRKVWKEAGISGVGKFIGAFLMISGGRVRKTIAAMLGIDSYPEVAQRYRKLGLLPEGSTGRLFWEHCAERGFSLPGEGGISEQIVFHDVGHLLAGYDTDPTGEIQQGSFQAGFVRHDGFAFLLFVLLQFHLGIQVTPIAAPEVGYFTPERVLTAVARGASCIDLSDRWDIWGVAEKPLEEVRALYHIPALV